MLVNGVQADCNMRESIFSFQLKQIRRQNEIIEGLLLHIEKLKKINAQLEGEIYANGHQNKRREA